LRLRAHMIDIEQGPSINIDNEFSINKITILDEKFYKEGTKLGDDDKDCWYTYTHYRGNNSQQTIYQLGFELFDVAENEKCKDYNIKIRSGVDEDSCYSLKYDEIWNIYYDPSKTKFKNGKIQYDKKTEYIPVGLDTSGVFFIDVFNSSGILKYISPPILVLPSSMSYEDYIFMINDLLRIKDDLVINNKAKVAFKGNWEYRIDSVRNCLNNISNSMKRINDNPAVNLFSSWTRDSYTSIKKFKSRTLIEKSLFPFKNKYSNLTNIETTDIYENRVIKYALLKLKEKIESYRTSYKDEVNIRENEFKNIKHFTEKKYNKRLEDVLDEFNLNIHKLEMKIDYYKDTYIKQINSLMQIYNDIVIGDIDIDFSICKNMDITDKNIKLTFRNSKCCLIIKSYFKQGVYDLDLNNGVYKYKTKDETVNAQFCGRKIEMSLETCKLNEIVFLLECIYAANNEKKKSIAIKAKSILASYERNDPLGGDILPGYSAPVKKYNIKLTNIYSINGKCVPSYDKDYIIKTLLFHVDNIAFHELEKELNNKNEEKSFVESILKKSDIEKTKQSIFKSQDKEFDNIHHVIMSLLKLDVFKEVKDIISPWKPTQIFVNDPDYNIIWRNIQELDSKINFISEFNSLKFTVKNSHSLYEYWCYFKMIQVLIEEQRWEVENLDEIYDKLNKYLNASNYNMLHGFEVKLYHLIKDNDLLQLTIGYNKEVYYANDKNPLRPDYMFKFNYNNETKIAYVDAKYKNYYEQGKKEWVKDLKEVAIDNYIKKFEHTTNEPISSFIIHPDLHEEWTYFGGYLDERLAKDLEWDKTPNHKFGSFSFVPTKTVNFKTFMKMLLEYHLKLYDYCWNCGEVVQSDNKIRKVTKTTKGGFDKYHYICNNCGEFWVKNHCYRNGHNLIKHLYNYHSPDKRSNNPWYVVCPKCLDIDNNKSDVGIDSSTYSSYDYLTIDNDWPEDLEEFVNNNINEDFSYDSFISDFF